ncbi:MAG: RNA polymerase sigma factor [Thermoanaerobaculia bacterium]|nr:RNA polymerase sigma factor [Thermoanaerobaculia bacterium]
MIRSAAAAAPLESKVDRAPKPLRSVRSDANQDELFWRSAYEAHASVLLGFLRRRVGSPSEAEDLLQELFVRAMRADTFRRDAAIKPYLYSIARNLLASRFRRPKLRLVTSSPEEVDERDPLDRVEGDDLGQHERLEWSEFDRALIEALNELSDDHRLAFRLGVLEETPYSEIAARQGWTLSRVKVNVHRARRKIIEALADRIPSRSTDLIATASEGPP